MKHEDYHVQLLNEHGQIAGSKRRGDVDTLRDVLRVVHVLLRTQNGQFVLASIAGNDQFFAGMLGTTAATIVRVGESRHEAAERVLQTECGMTGIATHLVDETWDHVPPLAARRTATLSGTIVVQEAEQLDTTRFSLFSAEQMNALWELQPGKCAPTLRAIWERYSNHLSASS